MKRKITGWVLISLLSLSLIGCGKSEEEKELEAIQEELGMEEFSDLDALLREEQASYERDRKAMQEEEMTKEETISSYKKYEADPGWDKMTPDYGVIQIDDTLYTYGGTVDEIIQQIDSSSVEYTYDYNPDKLIKGFSTETIQILRDGYNWFSIRAFNYLEETVGLKDCIVVYITEETEAVPFCRYIDGRNIEDFSSLTYEDVTALTETMFPEETWTYYSSDGQWTDENGESYSVLVEEFTLALNYASPLFYHTGYDIHPSLKYSFRINADTGKVVDVSMSTWAFTYKQSAASQYHSFSEIDDSQLQEFTRMAEEEITGYLGAVSFEGLKIYLTEYMGGTGLFFSYKASYEDGVEKYAYVEFVKAGLLPNGKVGYEKLFCDEQELDKGPFEVHTSLSRGLIEEIPYSN